jgi:sterol 3beta-glucosyltransferase
MPGGIERWEPSAELRAFLEEGEKPVLFSFGTLESLDPKRARDLALGAARLAKVRAIVQAKSEGRTEKGRDGDLYFLPWAPHQALLPRCSAMVHHGGAGTTHAPLAAGIPAVVVPFIFEQGLWGGLVHRAGVAPRPLSFWKATPEKLAALIREVTGSQAMKGRARQLGEAVSREDGTGRAVELLEKLLASPISEPRRCGTAR